MITGRELSITLLHLVWLEVVTQDQETKRLEVLNLLLRQLQPCHSRSRR